MLVGATLGILTLLFFMALVLMSVAGHSIPDQAKFPVAVVLALGCGLSIHFLGGTAAAKGHIPLAFARHHPVSFGVTGGVAVVVIILLLSYFLYLEPVGGAPSVVKLFRRLEDPDLAAAQRLEALRALRDHHGVRDFRRRNLSGLPLPKAGWSGIELTEANLRATDLSSVSFQECSLVRADLSNARCDHTDFRNSELNGASMNNAKCFAASFDGIMLRGGKYNYAQFENSGFAMTWMMHAEFKGTDFTGARLRGASFSQSLIAEAVFRGADLSSANLSEAVGIDSADFQNARYNDETRFPPGFDAAAKGMIHSGD